LEGLRKPSEPSVRTAGVPAEIRTDDSPNRSLELDSPLLEDHRHRWEDNIKIDVKEIACEVVDWIQLIQGGFQWRAFVNTVTDDWVL
jgi:hypothetical protein